MAQQSELQRIEAIQKQIHRLQQELQRVKRDLAVRHAQTRAAEMKAADAPAAAQRVARAEQQPRPADPFPPAPVAPTVTVTDTRVERKIPPPAELYAAGGAQPHSVFRVGAVSVSLGGWVELDGINRSRNEVTDIGSSWNAIPLNNVPAGHQSEFRMTARRSRLAALVEGMPDAATVVRAYVEGDFAAAAATSNSVESNSYVPRLRQFYATYGRRDLGLQVLAGQAWSLITLNKIGIVPREEEIPITIDQSYVPGFTYTRAPQFRITKYLDDRRIWLGLSLESPQATYYVGPNGTGVAGGANVNFDNPGGSGFSPATGYSTDPAPDLVLKATLDPGWGHYELYGLGRLLKTRTDMVGSGHGNVVPAGGAGAAFIVPLLPGDLIQLQGSVLAGSGIGRYGVTQLPDATIGRAGQPVPIPEAAALFGVIGHPTPAVDIYSYVGTEQESPRAFSMAGRGYGYGSPLYSNAGCGIELSPLSCTANTSGASGGVIGAWWRFLHGNAGTLMTGASYTYVRRNVFKGIGGEPAVNENVFMASVRYYPFE